MAIASQLVQPASPARQRGAVAVVVALSALVLFGFAGMAIDVGRLYVNRTELQTAADACALAASAELICDPAAGACPAAFLLNAQAAGIYAAGRNVRDFQVNPVTIAPANVKFYTALAPNTSYLSIAGGASTNSRYVMCTASAAGIAPWFMGVLGAGAQTVATSAVATGAPSKSFCNAAPLGVCTKAGGYAVGEWISSTFTTNGNNNDVVGGFKWVDFTPNAGGNNEIREQLIGNSAVCNIQVGNNVQQPGQQQGAKAAYNTRFGMYPNGANGYTTATAPPDHTGYAYPNQAPGAPVYAEPPDPIVPPYMGNAYGDYRTRQGSNTPFINNQYGVSGPGGNIPGNPITAADHLAFGGDRRLVAAPMIDCAGGNVVPIVGMACVLMLNPMSNGATGRIFLEYRGLATAAGSPCRTGGMAGGPTATGPQVPTLVQ
jgi:Flp pilus assembly protein TadG